MSKKGFSFNVLFATAGVIGLIYFLRDGYNTFGIIFGLVFWMGLISHYWLFLSNNTASEQLKRAIEERESLTEQLRETAQDAAKTAQDAVGALKIMSQVFDSIKEIIKSKLDTDIPSQKVIPAIEVLSELAQKEYEKAREKLQTVNVVDEAKKNGEKTDFAYGEAGISPATYHNYKKDEFAQKVRDLLN